LSYPDGSWQILGIASPSQLTADQNDWAPADFSEACGVLRFSVDADGRRITGFEVSGIASPIAGTTRLLLNVGTTKYATIGHQDTGSAVANRVICPGGSDFNIPAGGGAIIWYDGSTARWRIVEAPQTSSGSSEPSGTMKMWLGASGSPPTGYLYCDGSAVSRTTYSALFAVIGTTFGSGDGSTTFNIPDMRAKFPQGADGTDALGATGGSKTPTIADSGHTHGAGSFALSANNAQRQAAAVGNNTAAAGATVGGASASGTASISTADGRPPFVAVHYIVKT
jgi:microcystin-dependent protein